MSVLLPLNIVAHEENVNLLEVSHNATCLSKIAHQYKLRKHCDAVLLSNRAGDRFRLIAMFYSVPVLILPPIHPEERLSLYLKVSQWLRKFCQKEDLRSYVDEQIKHTKVKMERQKQAAIALKKRAANG